MFEEGRLGDHYAITQTPKVSGIFHLFGENVTCIDDAGDVDNHNITCVLAFTYHILAKVEMLDTLGGACGRPIYGGLVVVVDCGASVVVDNS